MAITIVAQIEAKEGKAEALAGLLESLIPTTLAEADCEAYQLHRSLENERLFHFHEVWTSKPLWEANMEAPHLKDFGARSENLVEDWRLFQLERIS